MRIGEPHRSEVSTTRRVLPLILLAFACHKAVPPPAPPPAPRAPPPVSNILERIGITGYAVSPLGPRAVGLLLPAQSRWGRSLSTFITPGGGVAEPQPHYEFHHGAGLRPWSVLFRCEQPCGDHWRKDFPMSGAGGELVASVGAGLLAPGADSPFPLGKAAHLVEVEVNGDAGAGGMGHFVATLARPLDGVDAERLLDRALARFEEHVAQNAATLQALYEREWTELSGMPPFVQIRGRGDPAPSPRSHTVIIPRWHEEGRLEVVFIRRLVSADHLTMENLDETPCGFPSQSIQIAAPPYSAVELGQRLQVTADGAVTVLETFPAGIVDERGQYFAHIPNWSHTSRRNCPEYGAPVGN